VSPNIRMALADLRNAIREPLDTCVNCYRAVESVRQERALRLARRVVEQHCTAAQAADQGPAAS
jgi:hypothetical protein